MRQHLVKDWREREREKEKWGEGAYFVGSRQSAYVNSYVQYANRQVSLS